VNPDQLLGLVEMQLNGELPSAPPADNPSASI